jgi:hypothetical protein
VVERTARRRPLARETQNLLPTDARGGAGDFCDVRTHYLLARFHLRVLTSSRCHRLGNQWFDRDRLLLRRQSGETRRRVLQISDAMPQREGALQTNAQFKPAKPRPCSKTKGAQAGVADTTIRASSPDSARQTASSSLVDLVGNTSNFQD